MNRVSSVRRAAVLAVVCAAVALAQSDLGSISGFVRDPSAATVPNAKVTVKNETGLERQTTTNESGYYVVTNVPPGLYSVAVEASGFKKFDSTNNKLDPSARSASTPRSASAPPPRSVEVTASAAAVADRIGQRAERCHPPADRRPGTERPQSRSSWPTWSPARAAATCPACPSPSARAPATSTAPARRKA